MNTFVLVIGVICVGVFMVISILALLHVSGIRELPNPDHGKVLFKILVVEIVLVSVGAFANLVAFPTDSTKAPLSLEQEQEEAKVLADKVLDLISEQQFAGEVQQYLSDEFERRIADGSFSAVEFVVQRSGLGTMKTKRLLDQTKAESPPNSGSIYIFNYLNTYDSRTLHEKLTVIYQNNAVFKLQSFSASPIKL